MPRLPRGATFASPDHRGRPSRFLHPATVAHDEQTSAHPEQDDDPDSHQRGRLVLARDVFRLDAGRVHRRLAGYVTLHDLLRGAGALRQLGPLDRLQLGRHTCPDPCGDVAVADFDMTAAEGTQLPARFILLPVLPEWRFGVTRLAHALPAGADVATGFNDRAHRLAKTTELNGDAVEVGRSQQVHGGHG